MRVLFAAAISFAAAAATAAGAVPRAETLVTRTGGPIAGFAQDGPLIAWFAPGGRRCNVVHVRSLANGLNASMPSQSSHNVTCTWQVGSERVALAIDRTDSNVLWALRERSPLEYDYLIGAGAGPGARREHRFQELAHTSRGAGLWLGGLAGDGNTLAYAVTSVDYEDEAGCLAGTASCAMKIESGGVYRFVGWRPQLVPNTKAAVELAASGDALAIVATGSVTKTGKPVPGADLPIEVVDARTGDKISSVQPQGTPVAIALAPHVLATLERTPLGVRVAWYDPATGVPLGSAPVASATAPELTASDHYVVFHVGRSIRGVEVATGRIRTLARAAAPPVGLSLEGTRLAWAENLKRSARIRALYLGAG